MDFVIWTDNQTIRPMMVLLYSICKCHEGSRITFHIAGPSKEEIGSNQLEQVVNGFETVELDYMENVMSCSIPEIIDRLPHELGKILWLDVNCLVKGRLDGLFETDIKDCAVIACRDINSAISGIEESLLDECGMDHKFSLFSTDVMMINLEYWRRRDVGRLISDSVKSGELSLQQIYNRDLAGKVRYAFWGEYCVPPCFYRLNLKKVVDGQIDFATYGEINSHSDDSTYMSENMDITSRIMENARIISYCRNESRPWVFGGDDVYWVYRLYHPLWLECEQQMLKTMEG